jgi:hypothetical protein
MMTPIRTTYFELVRQKNAHLLKILKCTGIWTNKWNSTEKVMCEKRNASLAIILALFGMLRKVYTQFFQLLHNKTVIEALARMTIKHLQVKHLVAKKGFDKETA